jgi:WXG100 family type VII secretion target
MPGSDGYLEVQFENVAQGAIDLGVTHRALVQTLEDLDAQLQGSLAAWDSEAQKAYYTAKTNWTLAANHMAGVLQALGGHVGTAEEHYRRTEIGNTSMWAGQA